MQASSCTPLAFKSSACCTNPGRWVWNQQDKGVNHGKTINAQVNVAMQTFEQPGVKAPGTAKRTPFFPLKSWSIETLFPGSPSWTSTAGRASPTWNFEDFENSKRKKESCSLLPIIYWMSQLSNKCRLISLECRQEFHLPAQKQYTHLSPSQQHKVTGYTFISSCQSPQREWIFYFAILYILF